MHINSTAGEADDEFTNGMDFQLRTTSTCDGVIVFPSSSTSSQWQRNM